MQSNVKSFVNSFARGMARRQAGGINGRTDPERRTEQVRELGVEAVAKALRKQEIRERSANRLAS